MVSQKISVIIPTLNEESNIGGLVNYMHENALDQVAEIIVCDGGSKDKTLRLAMEAGARTLTSPKRGRAAQMNFGASQSFGDILYFVHADTIPPKTYVSDILEQVKLGYQIGCYRFRFDSTNWLLKINSFFTRFDRLMFRGGDQSLFVSKKVFASLDGYRDDYLIMEEYEFLERARTSHSFVIIPKDVIVSARKYDGRSYLRVNLANLIIFNKYRRGCHQDELVQTYYHLLKHPNYDHFSKKKP